MNLRRATVFIYSLVSYVDVQRQASYMLAVVARCIWVRFSALHLRSR